MLMAPGSTAAARQNDSLPRFTVSELNQAIGTLIERGFAPRFLLEATVGRPQQKKGHLWLSLLDGQASIQGVIWASQLQKLSFVPQEGDGVVVVGKLNFWAARASLTVQVLDLRPSLTTVLRQFEQVRDRLEPEGLFDPERKRSLPAWPRRIALLTSVPSAALADMLRTARERWPATELLVVPIPVQGNVESQIISAIDSLGQQHASLGLEALVLARGGGSREDLAVFDGEQLARCLAASPWPVVCGIGHEDDVTIADLVADYRAATPTAALVAVLPDRSQVLRSLAQERDHLQRTLSLRLASARQRLTSRQEQLLRLHPRRLLEQQQQWLARQRQLLQALSPQHLLARGFSLLRDGDGRLLRSVSQLRPDAEVIAELADGRVAMRVQGTEWDGPGPESSETPDPTAVPPGYTAEPHS
ncbi:MULTISPECIES: exodeoxyribonuclease VII large subunit [unclassified Cyanobium]|uniref:exodeoxyribonuclease VII large subunit n=1 Tax=unclassified Cyanobium TaxID=2627006 RepID=UPI0020CD3169|nr:MULTISPECIES: exodeoxyribonuclease VII large subunit [unclassified Cyanobium]MCP9860454.1 exodeoxyribonuclease VII large subunit [Cyanobium sp. Cruz-8H5]MCP9867724.1 exodeoxyribonuclease VII large subunit [Cyanobium sp. Cruz-8D1]